MLTDADLTRRCRQGDADAWRQLIRTMTPKVYRVTVRMLGYGADADDATQETFMRVHKSFDTFDATRPLTPWISRIAYNVCLRKLGRVSDKVTDTTDPSDFARVEDVHVPGPEGQVAHKQRDDMVLDAMETLSAQDRVIVTLRYQEGLSVAEVAEATGMPVNTIKTRLFRARGKLKKILAPMLRGGA